MQKIAIQNFGPIVKESFEINDVLLFIGPQASGKSTVSKSIYFFKSLREDLSSLVIDCVNENTTRAALTRFSKKIRVKFLKLFGPINFRPNFYLRFDFSKTHHLELKSKDGFIDPVFSLQFVDGFNQIISTIRDYNHKKSFHEGQKVLKSNLEFEDLKRNFYRQVESGINQIFFDNRECFYIPSGRSLLATLSDFLNNKKLDNIDFLTLKFIEEISNIKKRFGKGIQELIKEKTYLANEPVDMEILKNAEQLISKILRADYRIFNGEERLYYDKTHFTKINYSSSGQQESIWILLFIFNILVDNIKIFAVFEEPEAHLYPEAQKYFVELIGILFNQTENQIVITTHSPYVLESINNLILAKTIVDKGKDIGSIVNKRALIPFEKVDAYLIQDGKMKLIEDKEIGQIKSESIDVVSSILNKEFDSLIEKF